MKTIPISVQNKASNSYRIYNQLELNSYYYLLVMANSNFPKFLGFQKLC